MHRWISSKSCMCKYCNCFASSLQRTTKRVWQRKWIWNRKWWNTMTEKEWNCVVSCSQILYWRPHFNDSDINGNRPGRIHILTLEMDCQKWSRRSEFFAVEYFSLHIIALNCHLVWSTDYIVNMQYKKKLFFMSYIYFILLFIS